MLSRRNQHPRHRFILGRRFHKRRRHGQMYTWSQSLLLSRSGLYPGDFGLPVGCLVRFINQTMLIPSLTAVVNDSGTSCAIGQVSVLSKLSDCFWGSRQYCCPVNTPLAACYWNNGSGAPDCANAICSATEVEIDRDEQGKAGVTGGFACNCKCSFAVLYSPEGSIRPWIDPGAASVKF